VTGLRIGWATPWNQRSAICSSAAEVAFELAARGHRVTVLRTERGEARDLPLLRPPPGPIHHLDDLSDTTLDMQFDVVVAHIGNHLFHHGAAVDRLQGYGMVGIFHDMFLGHLALAWFDSIGRMPELVPLARELYGEEGMPDSDPFWGDLGDMVRRRPMLEWLARHCTGAVAHAAHYVERLRAACPGPVATIPLAFTVPDLPPPPSAGKLLTVASVGYANTNKRIDEVILAIGASPILRGRCRLRVIGEASPEQREHLVARAAACQLDPPEFTGWVNDEELRRQLRDVDVISCLRNPVLEGASASAILAMSSGRPTLVTHHGGYADIPADAALHCRPEAEALDTMRHLEWILAHPAEGAAIGARGRAHALRHHTPGAYVDALLPLLEQVIANRPPRPLDQPRHQTQARLLSTLSDFGLGLDDPAVRRMEAVLDSMQIDAKGIARAQKRAGLS
jgi:glycosyltransferase involved in cell wall biosynthesis